MHWRVTCIGKDIAECATFCPEDPFRMTPPEMMGNGTTVTSKWQTVQEDTERRVP